MASFEFKPQNANNTGYPATAYGAGDKAKYGGDSGTGSGQVKYKVLDFVIDQTDPAVATDADFIASIPAGATIVSCEVKVAEALSGGTGLDVGLVNPDGTSADPDALVAAASETAVGSYIVGSGAAIGTSVTEEKQLTSSNRTAGVIEVRLVYIA